MNTVPLKTAYVRTFRGLRTLADSVGALSALEHSSFRSVLWLRSLFGIYDSTDLIRLDLPWWTFGAVDAVATFLDSKQEKARVFEFGAGASTVWLARRSAEVISVDHDAEFIAPLRSVLEASGKARVEVVRPVAARGVPGEARSNRAGYEELAFDEYVETITRQRGTFDLIVIDGRSRSACLAAAIPKLADGGIVLFDNSNRAEYQAALYASGLELERLRGWAPALPFPSETSLLRRRS